MNHTNYIEKILNLHNGALVLFAAAPSWGITQLFKTIFKGVSQKELVMPLVVSAVGIFVFFLLYLGDLRFGLKASKHLGRRITQRRLWESFWKLFFVVLLMFCLTMFSFLFVALHLETIYNMSLIFMTFLMVMACLYEFKSIGDKMKIIYEKKPPIFNFFDRILVVLDKKIIEKFEKLFT